MMLEAIVAWYGRPLTAVLDAAAQDVARHPERWARLFGDLDGEAIRVEWVAPLRPAFKRDRFMGRIGDFRSASQLVTFAATGVPR
jgi:hypothetical protein